MRVSDLKKVEIEDAKPFLKWAGGKTQLLKDIESYLPQNINQISTYAEPFVGSGAVMFWMLKKYKNIQNVVINDINADLINVYKTIKNTPDLLIKYLDSYQKKYLDLNEDGRKQYFLEQRHIYNFEELNEIEKSGLFIFLNKTSFNGLYRVNSKNKFNVPFGRYTNPKICDVKTIFASSNILQKVELLNSDYTEILQFVDNNSFVYFDPPYKPISKTSSFNSYSYETFDDNEQIRLFEFCRELDLAGVKWMLSNSDPKNLDDENDFFDELYQSFNIYRVQARRNINSNGDKRGKINEIIINNYNDR